jgi:hypothetical protein
MDGQRYKRHKASDGDDERADVRHALARNVRLSAAFAYAGGVPVEAREMLAWDEVRKPDASASRVLQPHGSGSLGQLARDERTPPHGGSRMDPCGWRSSERSFGDDTPPIPKTPGFEGVTTVFRRVTDPHSCG